MSNANSRAFIQLASPRALQTRALHQFISTIPHIAELGVANKVNELVDLMLSKVDFDALHEELALTLEKNLTSEEIDNLLALYQNNPILLKYQGLTLNFAETSTKFLSGIDFEDVIEKYLDKLEAESASV